MSKIPFTGEQMKLLKENPYTFRVTPNTLCLTKKFKGLLYEEYQSSEIPRDILEKYSYPAVILGNHHDN